MPGSMATDDLSVRNYLCPYNNCAICADRTPFQCPADLAICCINDILVEISSLRSSEEQEERFSKILERHLNELYKVDVECFWALHEKPTEKEIKRASTQKVKRTKPKSSVLNKAIQFLNDEFHSVPLLEELVKNSIGTGHMFGMEADNDGLVFRAYSSRSFMLSEKDDFYTCKLCWPRGKSFKNFVVNFDEEVPFEGMLENVKNYCSSWGEWAVDFRKQLLKIMSNQLRARKTGKDAFSETENIAIACAHFALIMLYAENNRYHHVSYLLAPTLHGDSHSSMVVFWPFIASRGSVGPHMRFLLHMALGLNAIQESTRYETTKLVHKVLRHDMQSLLNDLSYPITKLMQDIDTPTLSSDEKLTKLKSIKSFVNLSFQSIGLEHLWSGREKDLLTKETESLSNFHKEFLLDLELDGFPVFCTGEWNPAINVPKAIRIVLANLIRNATAPVKNQEVHIVVNHDENQVGFQVMSEEPVTEKWRKQAFKKAYDRNVPKKHLGLWICRTIIRRLNGRWGLEQANGKYKTVVSFTIPRE
jgi:hypothetical protein